MIVKRILSQSLNNAMIGSVLLPLLFGVIVAATLIFQQFKWLTQSIALKNTIEIVYDLGALIHEQQKERGATSVFLASRGEEFGSQLRAQREKTDREAADFKARIEAIGRDRLPKELLSEFDVLIAGLAERQAVRVRVDKIDIATPEALGHYTKHNAAILRSVKKIGAVSTDTKIVLKVIAIESFLMAKEFSGIERAIGSGGFAKGEFDIARLLLLESLISRQNLALTRFLDLTTENWAAKLKEISRLPEVAAIEKMRNIARQGAATGDLEGITAEQFFAATTVRINAFKEMEDALIAEVSQLARQQFSVSLLSRTVLVLGILLVLAATVLVTRFSIRNMLVAVRKISNAGDRLAKGDKNVEMPTEVPSELGRIVWSINYFRESVTEAQDRETRIIEERNRSEAQAREAEAERQRAENRRAQEEAAQAREEQQKLEAYTSEMAAVVAACATGDFSQRLSLEGKEGVLAEIASGLNQISDGVADSLDEIKNALSHLAEGNLT